MLVAEKLGRLLRRRDGRCALVAAFVHRVAPLLGTISSLRSRKASKAAWLSAWRDLSIYVHRTFVGMSVEVRAPHTSADISQLLDYRHR